MPMCLIRSLSIRGFIVFNNLFYTYYLRLEGIYITIYQRKSDPYKLFQKYMKDLVIKYELIDETIDILTCI